MNILYVSFPNGGLDTNVRILANGLIQAGHRASILYFHDSQYRSQTNNIDTIPAYSISQGGAHYYFGKLFCGRASLSRNVSALEAACSLGRFIKRHHSKDPVDLIEIPEIFITSRLLGIPYIVRLHSADWTWRKMLGERERLSDFLDQQMERIILRHAVGISSPDLFLKDYIQKSCKIKNPIWVIPYPVDIDLFRPASSPPQKPMILFVGRVERRKGAHLLMQAIPHIVQKYPGCEFVFIGKVCEDVEEFTPSASKHMRFIGSVDHDKLPEWYQKAWIFCAPSLWDNSPNTIYEAMSCGLPVVATKVGGIPELVDDNKTGLLIPPNDSQTLIEALDKLLGDPGLRTALGQNGRRKVEQEYDSEKIIRRTLQFYGQVLSNR